MSEHLPFASEMLKYRRSASHSSLQKCPRRLGNIQVRLFIRPMQVLKFIFKVFLIVALVSVIKALARAAGFVKFSAVGNQTDVCCLFAAAVRCRLDSVL